MVDRSGRVGIREFYPQNRKYAYVSKTGSSFYFCLGVWVGRLFRGLGVGDILFSGSEVEIRPSKDFPRFDHFARLIISHD